ncbi:MAG: RNA 2',3'-cyclic phosphodiesterase [Acidobacteria bacterium]|nr:RNA 2',3'-cyclic phosphodiesterase [Acidobacteriota bacterium]
MARVLRPLARGARWVPAANLHLTLKFIGEVPDQRLGEVSAAVSGAVAGEDVFGTCLEGVGVFPSERRARVLWVGLADAAGLLARLAGRIEAALEALGVPRERRRFVPHLTVARMSPSAVMLPAGLELAPCAFDVDRVRLFRSRLGRPAPRYETLAELALGRRSSPSSQT